MRRNRPATGITRPPCPPVQIAIAHPHATRTEVRVAPPTRFAPVEGPIHRPTLLIASTETTGGRIITPFAPNFAYRCANAALLANDRQATTFEQL